MTSRKETPSVNDAISVRKISVGGVRRNITEVDLSRVDPDAPPPDDKTIQGLLQEIKGSGKKEVQIFLKKEARNLYRKR